MARVASPRVSIVFPAHPSAAPLVRRSVMALRAQTTPARQFEVIVAADGGDPDGQLRRALEPEAQPFACRVVPSPRPHGDVPHRNHTRNTGCREATGEILWVIDADFLLSPEAIEHLLIEHDRALAAGRVGFFSPTLAGADGPPDVWLQQTRAWSDAADPGEFAAWFEALPTQPDVYSGFADRFVKGESSSEPCPDLREGFPSFPRAVWEALGGYDEAYLRWGGNKEDLVRRLKALAEHGPAQTRLLRSVRAVHQPHPQDPHKADHNAMLIVNREYFGRRIADIQAGAAWWIEERERATSVLERTLSAARDGRREGKGPDVAPEPAGPRRLSEREPVFASLASIPSRRDMLRAVVESLAPQCDRVRVFLNDYPDVPGFLDHPRVEVRRSQDHEDKGDAGKFAWTDEDGDRGFRIIADDDLVYPPDFAEKMVESVERYRRGAVVGLHGVLLRQPVSRYHDPRSRHVFHFTGALDRDRAVHVLGTNAVAYHASRVRMRWSDFAHRNMADIFLAIHAQQEKIPMIAIARAPGWVRQGTLHASHETIYDASQQRTGTAFDSSAAQDALVRAHAPLLLRRAGAHRVVILGTIARPFGLSAVTNAVCAHEAVDPDLSVVIVPERASPEMSEALGVWKIDHELLLFASPDRPFSERMAEALGVIQAIDPTDVVRVSPVS